MQDQWIREGQAFIIVYSITSKPTFDEMGMFIERIARAVRFCISLYIFIFNINIASKLVI